MTVLKECFVVGFVRLGCYFIIWFDWTTLFYIQYNGVCLTVLLFSGLFVWTICLEHVVS